MPFIVSRVNTPIDQNQKRQITDAYIEMLERILGKSRNFVMIDLQDNCPLYVRGDDEVPAAYIEINVYNNKMNTGYDQLSEEITKLYAEVLDIPTNNVFINYSDVPGFSINGDFY